MKKILLIFIALLGFALIGCNSGGSSYNYDEVIGAPTNLSISGTTLSWNSVANSKGYNVYVNGTLEDEVKTTSYDFSALTENNLIFKVQTKAPRGYQDSGLSLSIAYVKNKSTEISSVKQVLTSKNLSVPSGFAEELVNKGMTSSQLTLMIDNIQNAFSNMENINSLSSAFTTLNGALDSVENVEAIVSAVVQYILPNILNGYIANYQAEINMYNGLKSTNPTNADYYQSLIDQKQEQLDQIQAYQTYLIDNSESAILSITNSINYLMSVEQALTTDMINTISSMMDRAGTSTLNTEEVLVVKDEMVSVLKENMPSMQDMVMLVQFEHALMSLSGQTNDVTTSIDNYSTKQAAQFLMSINLLIDFLDSIDADYLNSVKSFSTSSISDEMLNAEISILSIKQFAQFKKDDQKAFDSISNVFTDEEKQLIYESNLTGSQGLYSASEYNDVYSALTQLDFNKLLYLSTVMGDAFDAVLDKFVETDGEIIRLITIQSAFTYEGTYNSVLDEYFTSTQYYEKSNELEIQIAEQATLIFGAGFQAIDQSSYETFLDYFVSIYPFESLFAFSSINTTDITSAFRTATAEALKTTAGQQLELNQNLFNFIEDNDIFSNELAVQADINSYYSSNYGYNYFESNSSDYYDDDYKDYANIVFAAGNYYQFMTSANRQLVDDILDNAFTYLRSDTLDGISALTSTQINDIETNIGNLLDYMKSETNTIKDYNYKSLTPAQIFEIKAFQDTIRIYISSIEDDLALMTP